MSEWTTTERAFVGAAYALCWVTLLTYALYLRRRLRRARETWRATAPERQDAEIGR